MIRKDGIPTGTAGSQAGSDPSHEVDASSQLVWHLQLRTDQGVDRSRIRRALDEATRAWPGNPRDLWWRWILEAGHSLDLRCRVLDCTLEQIQEIASEGGRILIRTPSHGEWFAVDGTRRRKLVVHTPEGTREKISATRFRKLLGGSASVPIRCIVLEPQLSGELAGDHHAEHMTPLARTWALLRPEMGDVWIILMFALASGMLALATPLAIESLVSTVMFGRLAQPIFVLSLLLLTFLSFQAAIRGLQTFVVEIIQRRLFARVAADLAYRLPRTRFEALENHSGRELLNRFMEIVTIQKVAAQFLLDGTTVVLNTLIGMAVLGFYHPWLLGFDVVLLAMIAFAIFVLGRGAVTTSIKESKCKYHIISWLEDLAACVTTFRLDGAAEFALERTDRLTYEYLTARRDHFRILLRQIIFALAVQAIASTVLLGLGGWLVVSGQLTLGQLVAAELIVTVIVTSFAKLGKHMESYYDLMASVDKIGHLIDLPVESQEGMLSMPMQQAAEVKLDSVGYVRSTELPLFANLNLTIPSGARVALSGPSGSGKSVLLDMLFGLREPHSGHLTINDADPRELRPDVLRQCVALVRDIEVFEGSLAENVHLERPNVNTHDVRDALDFVGLLDEVLRLPEGLKTELNATGYPLTPTQLRKLMLARAIVGNPRLLLIDGALDAFPDADAHMLATRLCERQHNWTLVIVTGREALMKLASLRLKFPSHDSNQALTTPLAEVTQHAH